MAKEKIKGIGHKTPHNFLINPNFCFFYIYGLA